MRSYSIILILLVSSFVLFGQQPSHEKKSFVDSTGRYYQQASLPVYLFIANSTDGKPLPLQPLTKKEIQIEGHGIHAFKHENIITKSFDEFMIYADGIPPVSTSGFTAATQFQAAGNYFYGAGLTVSVQSTDEMSGVEAIYHSINGNAFTIYSQPDFLKEGNYQYSYYAVDRTGNVEEVKTKIFTVDLSTPKTFHNVVSISSQDVVSTNSTIYLSTTDSLSGIAKTFYKFDKEDFRVYNGGNINFKYLPDGEHTLTYYSADNAKNKETEKSFKFYLDKTAPIMSADVLGDKFLVGKKVYFSGRTKLKLTAVDNKSGIKDVMYSVNNQAEVKYTEPFYLPNRSGLHNVSFRAIDHTNNQIVDDFEHSIGVIYVDLTGPSLTLGFMGTTFNKADTVFISPETKVTLSGNDPEAGLKKLTYSIDGDVEETLYSKPIEIKKIGPHKLIYNGYDNVNNKNLKEAFFVVDTNGPTITSQFAAPANAEGKYPSYTTLYLAAADAEVGADQIWYSINGAKEQMYIAPIKGFVKSKDYTLEIRAVDLLGNSSKATINFSTDKY